MKVLRTGDFHIGRRPIRLLPHVDCRSLSGAAVWSSIISNASNQQVDVVAIGGEVVDRANRYVEAIGSLARRLRRLAGYRPKRSEVDISSAMPGASASGVTAGIGSPTLAEELLRRIELRSMPLAATSYVLHQQTDPVRS